jgi:hypothetical protein
MYGIMSSNGFIAPLGAGPMDLVSKTHARVKSSRVRYPSVPSGYVKITSSAKGYFSLSRMEIQQIPN